jgi:membrane protease YdiL (CAAX protease family)
MSLIASLSTPIELGSRRVLHPGPLRWLRALAWMVGLFILIGMAGYTPIVLIEFASPTAEAPIEIVKQAAGALSAIGVYVLMVWLAEGRLPSELAPNTALPGIALGLLIGFLVMATVLAVLVASGLYDFRWTGPTSAWIPTSLAIQSGVIEEVMARAVLLRLMWRAFGPWVAFAFSAAVFGALHLPNPNSSLFAALAIALEAGVMLGAFYALTGRLWVSIGLHAGWNFTQGYVFGAAVSGTDFGGALARSVARPGSPEWLTGGAFGPEASLPALLICTGIGVATLWWAWKLGRFAKPASG